MKRLSLAIGSLLILGAPAWAIAGDQGPSAPKDGMAATAPMPPPGGDGRWHPMPPPGARPGPEDWALRLAERLAGAETLIGIKTDQLDAWRDYTSALIDLFTPPAPEARPGHGTGDGKPDNALDREEQIARRMKDRAAKADALLQAITALRAKLTPQQIDRLATIELFPHPPMRGLHPDGHGPMSGDGWNRGPGPHRPGMPGPVDHGPMMMGPAGGGGGPDQAGPDGMDRGPGFMNGEAPPMVAEPETGEPGPDTAPEAPQQ